MKTRCSNRRNSALTLKEVLVVIAVLVLLAIFFAPALNSLNRRASTGSCAGLVKQIGLSFRVWAIDHGDKLPMEVSVVNGGAQESVAAGNVAAVFQVMSNELVDPRILHCPRDSEHSVFPLVPGPQTMDSLATNFSGDLKSHISYFIGLDASTGHPNAFLSGDDNFEIRGMPAKPGLLEISKDTSINWTPGRHTTYKRHFWNVTASYGYVCLADGSVQQTTISSRTNLVARSTGTITTDFTSLLHSTDLATNRLAVP